MTQHVVVIGAGAVGAATALTLAREGNRVTILEPGDPGGTQAASYGNWCWISPESVLPMGVPGIWKKVPGFLADPFGPLTIRWRYLPRLLPWLAVFLRANATVPKVERTSRALAALLHDAVPRHEALAAEAGAASLIAISTPGATVPRSRPMRSAGGSGARRGSAGSSSRPRNCTSASPHSRATTPSRC